MFKKAVIGLIKVYQWFSKSFLRKTCRFYPTCSQYTIEAVEKYGIFKGILKGGRRILKCHPWHPGGVDLP
jgi:putative membrane protein insertion efficiency factor